jgi:hypothetical protein
MKKLKVLPGILAAVSVALMLTACAPTTNTPGPLPTDPGGIQSPGADPTSSSEPSESPAEEPEELVAPSTEILPASGVQTGGLPQYPILEDEALIAVGVKTDSAYVVPSDRTEELPVQKIIQAGGTAPTTDYVLNLTYKLCNAVQAYQSQNLSLNDAFTKALAEVPMWVGFSSSEDAELSTAYMAAATTSYSYVCVPLFDEQARRDLENGVFRG